MSKSLCISRHFIKRARERLGLKKRAVERYALTAYKKGVIVERSHAMEAQKIVVLYQKNLLVLNEYPNCINFTTVINTIFTKPIKKRRYGDHNRAVENKNKQKGRI